MNLRYWIFRAIQLGASIAVAIVVNPVFVAQGVFGTYLNPKLEVPLRIVIFVLGLLVLQVFSPKKQQV